MNLSAVFSFPIWQLAVITLLVGFVVHFLISSWLLLRKSKRCSAAFDGPKPYFLIGNLDKISFDGKGLDYHVDCTKEYRTAYKVWFGPTRAAIFCVHPETIKAVTMTAAPKAMFAYQMVVPWLGWGLLISYGPKWQRMRRLLTPAFHFNILKPYVNVFQKSAKQMLANFDSVSDGHIELFRYVSMFTLDSMLKCALSYDSGCQIGVRDGEEKDPYIQAVFRLSKIFIGRIMNPLMHSEGLFYCTPKGREFSKLCDVVHKKAEDVIKARRLALQTQDEQDKLRKKRYLDFLDILLEAKDTDGVGLTDEEIRAEVDTFMFEGHDTTACGVTWTLYLLAKYPEHQRKCREEVEQLVKKKGNDIFEWDDLKSLDYLTLCIKESMRILPPVPMVGRDLDQDVVLDGKVAPKGSWIILQIYALHRNPDIWKDPEVFDPQRFTKENSKDRSPHAYLPFSSGPRNCIGQNFAMAEIKTVVALTLLKFDLIFDDEHKVELLPEVVLRSSNGAYIYVQPRKSAE